jgi:hypothetical protein
MSLTSVQERIAHAFALLAHEDSYHTRASPLSAAGQWNDYFDAVIALAAERATAFSQSPASPRGRAAFDALVSHGRRLNAARYDLQRGLLITFAGTLALVLIVIIAIPTAPWLCPFTFYVCWLISAILLGLLFIQYYRLVRDIIAPG